MVGGVLVGMLLISGCGTGDDAAARQDPGGAERLQVAATTTVLADIAENVAGETADVTSIVPPGGDPHVHEPLPADARTVADADLVVANGLGLEPWYPALEGERDGPTVLLGEEVDPALVLDDDDGEPDPHLWMVPAYATAYAAHIAEAMAELDPANADAYASGAQAYADELDELDAELARTFDAIPPDDRVLVTSHDAYAYFADHYGFTVAGTVVGVSTEEEPSAQRVRELVDAVRAQGVRTVFVELTVNPDVIEQIAREAGVEVGRPLHGDALGGPGSGAQTYTDMMRANADALVDGLAP